MTKKEIEFNKNEDHLKILMSDVKHKLNKIHLGGGKSKIEKLHGQGKLTARERIEFLLDKNKPQIEIGAFAGYEMYEEHGGCPAGGVVVVIGVVVVSQGIQISTESAVALCCIPPTWYLSTAPEFKK